jgi:hypothetical protein
VLENLARNALMRLDADGIIHAVLYGGQQYKLFPHHNFLVETQMDMVARKILSFKGITILDVILQHPPLYVVIKHQIGQ